MKIAKEVEITWNQLLHHLQSTVFLDDSLTTVRYRNCLRTLQVIKLTIISLFWMANIFFKFIMLQL